MKPLRLLVAVALFGALGTAVATAQTVVVRHAPAGQTIELFLNATKVATATVPAQGDTTLPLNLRVNHAGKTEIEANIFVDVCDSIRRVIVVERGEPAAAQEPGCDRRDITGLYEVRRVNTLVMDLGGANPTMMLIKGKYSPEASMHWSESPKGIVLFGGIGRSDLRDAVAISCGDASDCNGNKAGTAYGGGVTIWVTPFLGAEGGYYKLPSATARGTGSNFSFNSSLDPQVVTVAGRIGIPIHAVRISGQIGANFHDAILKTQETINGASQNFEIETRGWGWMWGAGMEIWAASRFAIYADVGFASMKGTPTGGGEAQFTDRLRFVAIGARVAVWK